MIDQPAHLRRDYPHILPLTTRWHDNDLYGHVNSATYYAYFDSAVTTYLIKEGGLNILRGEEVGVVTSGSFSPVLGHPIALGYVLPQYAEEGTELQARLRGRDLPITVVKRPFYKRGVTPVPGEESA